jgi:hypothetical protein
VQRHRPTWVGQLRTGIKGRLGRLAFRLAGSGEGVAPRARMLVMRESWFAETCQELLTVDTASTDEVLSTVLIPTKRDSTWRFLKTQPTVGLRVNEVPAHLVPVASLPPRPALRKLVVREHD